MLHQLHISYQLTCSRYTRGQGYPPLVTAISKMYSPDFNRNIDPMTEVMTAVGAYEALYNSLTAFINPGDEVITFLPGIDRDK